MGTTGPVTTKERIAFWDVLRGFAVLGVLLANMPLMSFSASLDMVAPPTGDTALDRFAFGFVRLVADTKFITIFSLLFGAGLAFMWERAEQRRAPFLKTWFRRMAVLFVFGAIHVNFIWFGDILCHYAFMGCIAVWMRRLRPKTLVIVGIVFLLLSAGMTTLMALAEQTEQEIAEGEQMRRACAEAFPTGDILKMSRVRFDMWPFFFAFMIFFWGARTLGLFLIGMALVKSGILLKPAQHLGLAKKAITIGFLFGIPVAIVNWMWADKVATPNDRLIGQTTLYFMAFFLSPAYMGVVALWTQTSALPWLQRSLAAVGRMAFTNYLSHSVITAIVFNYFHQYDRWSRFEGLVLTFGIYAFQLWVSPIWLARYRYGPLEWLWRRLTYGSAPRMYLGKAAS